MRLLRRAGALVTAVASAAVVAPWLAGTATAAPCPDAEIVFARGTTEDPGVGPTGQAFVDALRTKVGPKYVGTYAVDYPATMAFSTAVQGIADARAHILSTAAACPDTKMVLGGFSQGAAVMGFVTASVVPEGISPDEVPAPMPPEVADHVAAVVLFGKPSARFMNVIKDPNVVVGPYYAAKATELCADNDLVCDPHGRGFAVHNQYTELGLVDQGATFAAQKLQAMWAAEALTEGTGPLPGPEQAAALAAPVVPVETEHSGAAPQLPGPAIVPGPDAVSDPS